MARIFTPQFQYKERALDVYTDSEYNRGRLQELTEKRDKDLEQYLWAPYNHTAQMSTSAALPAQELVAGFNVIDFDRIDFDPEETLDLTTNRWTCPVEGIWHLQTGLFMENSGGTDRVDVYFRKNGINDQANLWWLDRRQLAAGAPDSRNSRESHSRNIPCSVGDYIELVVDELNLVLPMDVFVTGNDFHIPYLASTYVSNFDVGLTLT